MINAKLLQLVIDASNDGIVVAEQEGDDNILIYANPAFERLTGYSVDDILYQDCRFLQAGDFDCRPRCKVSITADTQPLTSMAARRPNTDEAIAMFIEDEAALWKLAGGASEISIEFPVRAGGTRTARFEVAGLDETKMPGWSAGAQ